MTTTHLGQPFIYASIKQCGITEFFNVIDGYLMTYGGYTNVIHHNQQDRYTAQEFESIKNLTNLQKYHHFGRYAKSYKNTFGENADLPTEATWC